MQLDIRHFFRHAYHFLFDRGCIRLIFHLKFVLDFILYSVYNGVLSVTLPFAVYITMSSAIAVIIGPVSWIGAGLFTIWKLTGANYKRLIPAILYVSALRAKQQGNFS